MYQGKVVQLLGNNWISRAVHYLWSVEGLSWHQDQGGVSGVSTWDAGLRVGAGLGLDWRGRWGRWGVRGQTDLSSQFTFTCSTLASSSPDHPAKPSTELSPFKRIKRFITLITMSRTSVPWPFQILIKLKKNYHSNGFRYKIEVMFVMNIVCWKSLLSPLYPQYFHRPSELVREWRGEAHYYSSLWSYLFKKT